MPPSTIHQTRGDTWELAWRDPVTGGAAVRSMTGFSDHGGDARRTVEPASAGARLIILLDDTLTITTTAGGPQRVRSFVAGPRATPVVVEQRGSYRGIEVGLSVTSAAELIGMPLGDLGASIVALDDLLDDRARRLHDRLAHDAGWSDAFGALDDCLRSSRRSFVDARLQWAWRAIERSQGRLPITTIATEIGWSGRHLASSFERSFGVTPKVAARLFRFEQATASLTAGTSPAETASACGYFDQAHMHRDFALFAASTPGQIAAGRTGELEAAWPLDAP